MASRIFIHGLESGNQGTKSVYFRKHFPGMIIPLFTGDLDSRMAELRRVLAGETQIRLVGSSFGGLMATLFCLESPERVKRLILLAPALNLANRALFKDRTVSVPAWVYHGRQDEVIPLAEVESIASSLFEILSFNAVDDDHFLHKTFRTIDWSGLLA